MYTYKTDFHLEYPVNDFDEAAGYLEEDDMVNYFNEDDTIKSKLESIRWILDDTENGRVIVEALEPLDTDELAIVSEYISGQNSDGLGEGFEQQDFANYDINLYDEYGEYNPDLVWDDDYEEFWVMASFDWEFNDYILDLER